MLDYETRAALGEVSMAEFSTVRQTVLMRAGMGFVPELRKCEVGAVCPSRKKTSVRVADRIFGNLAWKLLAREHSAL